MIQAKTKEEANQAPEKNLSHSGQQLLTVKNGEGTSQPIFDAFCDDGNKGDPQKELSNRRTYLLVAHASARCQLQGQKHTRLFNLSKSKTFLQ